MSNSRPDFGDSFNVAKTLEVIAPLLPPGLLTREVRPVLQKLASDDDKDCRFFAERALAGTDFA